MTLNILYLNPFLEQFSRISSILHFLLIVGYFSSSRFSLRISVDVALNYRYTGICDGEIHHIFITEGDIRKKMTHEVKLLRSPMFLPPISLPIVMIVISS